MDKLQFFRIKELKDVLTQLSLSKQGKKQDLVDRILAIASDDQASKMRPKKLRKEEVVRLVENTYRKMQTSNAHDLASDATDVASSPQLASGSTPVKPKEEIDDSPQVEMKIRCLCGSSLLTESMIRCEDPKCQIWQHMSCVIIPEKPIEGTPPVPPQFYCELCRLSRADPFLLTVVHPLYPVKLIITSMPPNGENPVQGVEKTFQITRTDRNTLSKPEYDVQAWCMLINDKVPFRMQWPQFAELQVNGVAVRAINRPGSQLLGASGRDDGPIITPYTRDGINRISLTGVDARLFCLGVRIVKRRTLPQILNMIPKESDGERFEDALARVRRCLSGGNDTENADSDSDLEVVADSLTVNLRCPMSGSRIKIAGRFKPCVHMGCFDLNPYVEMQQRSRKWQCPICLKNYSLEHIIIDPYFNRITSMMRVCGEDTTDIELKPDGSWRVKGDKEHRDLKQWHSPDGSVIHPRDEVKPKPETTKAVKQEGTGLKIGIKRNSNGRWEVKNKGHTDTVSSSDRFQGQKVIPMSSGDTGSDKECKIEGVDFTVNNDVELDSMCPNLDQTYGFSNQDADIIVLSDSDEENGNINTNSGHVDTGGVDLSHGGVDLDHAYQEDPTLGGGLDLFSSNVDDFSTSLWQLPPATQEGSSFQLFSPNVAGVSNPINCPTSMSDYPILSEAPINSYFPDSCVGHSNNNDLINDGLVDNPLVFGGEDPSLQIFLPTRPSYSVGHTDLQHQQDASNVNRIEDWISLRLGDGVGDYDEESSLQNGLNSGHVLQSKEGAPQSLPETASLQLNDMRSDKTRRKSDSPSAPPPRRQRMFLSIDTDP